MKLNQMNKKMVKKWIGRLMIASPFIAVFIFGFITNTFFIVLASFGIAALIFVVIYIGLILASEKSE